MDRMSLATVRSVAVGPSIEVSVTQQADGKWAARMTHTDPDVRDLKRFVPVMADSLPALTREVQRSLSAEAVYPSMAELERFRATLWPNAQVPSEAALALPNESGVIARSETQYFAGHVDLPSKESPRESEAPPQKAVREALDRAWKRAAKIVEDPHTYLRANNDAIDALTQRLAVRAGIHEHAPEVIGHGDAHLGQLVVSGDGQVRQLGIDDYDRTARGPYYTDLVEAWTSARELTSGLGLTGTEWRALVAQGNDMYLRGLARYPGDQRPKVAFLEQQADKSASKGVDLTKIMGKYDLSRPEQNDAALAGKIAAFASGYASTRGDVISLVPIAWQEIYSGIGSALAPKYLVRAAAPDGHEQILLFKPGKDGAAAVVASTGYAQRERKDAHVGYAIIGGKTYIGYPVRTVFEELKKLKNLDEATEAVRAYFFLLGRGHATTGVDAAAVRSHFEESGGMRTFDDIAKKVDGELRAGYDAYRKSYMERTQAARSKH